MLMHDSLHKGPYRFVNRQQTSGGLEVYHAHQGMEFLFVQQGQGLASIEQNIFSFKPYSLIFFQPYQIHKVRVMCVENEIYDRTKLFIEPSFFSDYFKPFPSLQKFFIDLLNKEQPTHILDLRNHANQFQILFDYFETNQNKENQTEQFALFLLNFIQTLKKYWPVISTPQVTPSLRYVHYAEKVMQWINIHYQEEFKLANLAEDLHISPYHISHLFHQATGSTIVEYLISRRIKEACWLLRTSAKSIQDISYAVGVPNISYFHRLFKKHTGLTPLVYRSTIK